MKFQQIKVDTEIPSPVSGVLVLILAKGETVASVNSVVAVIDAASPGAVAPAPAEEK